MSTTHEDNFELETTVFEPTVKEQMPQAGDHLGYYRIIELIAAGGMANVYKAWHEQLEVVRAIKILKPGFDDESKSRLETEAKISANLRHSNIVEIYGMGYWNAIPYLEMEYVDGPSLKELLEKNGRLPIDFSIALIHSLCAALQFAYNQDLTLYGKVYDGLIHRDLKPANVIISSKGIVKLADFGIARPSEVSLHTVNGKVMGTFAYLSPEQLNGEKLDQRSDIYALGTVLYEMLTGSKTYPQKMLVELVNRKTKGQYTPANTLCKSIPKQLNAYIDKSMHLDKTKRYSTAEEFDNEILTLLKKISSRNPEEIIYHFLKNPIPSHSSKQSKAPTLSILIVVFIFLALTLAGVFFLDHYWDGLFIDNQNVEQKEKPEFTNNTKKNMTSGNTKKTLHQYAKRKDDVSLKTTTKEYAGISKSPTTSYMSKEQKETATNQIIDTQQTIIQQLQTMIKNGYLDKALALSETQNINDAYFHYLKGEIFFKKDQLESAEEEFKKARGMHTQFDKNTSRNASLYLAHVRDALYMLKPNITNKQLSTRAWTTFLDMYCQDDQSQECSEAKDRIASLTH